MRRLQFLSPGGARDPTSQRVEHGCISRSGQGKRAELRSTSPVMKGSEAAEVIAGAGPGANGGRACDLEDLAWPRRRVE